MSCLQDEETMNSERGHAMWAKRFLPLLEASPQIASLCFPATLQQIATEDGMAAQIQNKVRAPSLASWGFVSVLFAWV